MRPSDLLWYLSHVDGKGGGEVVCTAGRRRRVKLAPDVTTQCLNMGGTVLASGRWVSLQRAMPSPNDLPLSADGWRRLARGVLAALDRRP